MSQELQVLIAGESWESMTIHQKGFDIFTTTFYEEGVGPLKTALEESGHQVTYMPSHIASSKFPTELAELQKYDVVVLSDIGTNTLLLHPDTFNKSMRKNNRLKLINEYTKSGGGLMMVGGYMTFQGIDAKARYAKSPVEEVLPVTMFERDDRVEVPEGVSPKVQKADHPIVAGLADEWPALLGYNQIIPKEDATVVATVGDDPLIAVWTCGKGRSVAFASDCGPHWAPPEFLAWEGYGKMWSQMVAWAGDAL